MIKNEITPRAREQALKDIVSTLIGYATNEFDREPWAEGEDWYISGTSLAFKVKDLYEGGHGVNRYGNITNADIIDLVTEGRERNKTLAEGLRVARILGRAVTQYGYGINAAKIEDLRREFAGGERSGVA
jgi:hypothetical protein